jgi:hypothetical protein
MKLFLESQTSSAPFPREILVVKRPVRDWEMQAMLTNSPSSSRYRDALDCVLAVPDERRSLDGEFGPADGVPRAPTLTVRNGVGTVVFNNPGFLRAWRYDPSGRRLVLRLQTSTVPAARAVTVVADLRDVTVESLRPAPQSYDGRIARWQLTHKDASAPWSQSSALITLKVRPAAPESFDLLRHQGAFRYLDQALWLLTRFSFVLAALFFAFCMWAGATGTAVRPAARQTLLALLALLALPLSLVLFSPGFNYYALFDRDVQNGLVVAFLTVPLLVASRLLRRRQVAASRASAVGLVVALVGTGVLLALPKIVEQFSTDRGNGQTGAVGVARSLSVALLPVAYVAAIYVALAGVLWLVVAVWPSPVFWTRRQAVTARNEPLPVVAHGSAAAESADIVGSLRLPTPRTLLAQVVLVLVALFVIAHSIVETLRVIGPWQWPTWRIDQLAARRGFFEYAFRAYDYPLTLMYQLIDLIPLVAFVALLLVLRARSLNERHPLFASTLELWAAAVIFAGLVGSSFGGILGFPAPVGFVLTVLLVRYVAVSVWAETVAHDVAGEADHGDTLRTHGSELLARAAAIERKELELSRLDDSRDTGEVEADEYERQRTAFLAEIQRLSTSGAAGGGTGLALPSGVHPEQVALALGPRTTPWENATAALRQGAALAVLPVTYYLYVLLTHQHILGFDTDFGPVRMLTAMAAEVGFWLAAAFVLGFAFPYLRGRNGVLKGLTLGAIYALAVAVGAAADSGYFAFNVGGNVFRVGELILFLALLGAGLDLETVRVGDERRTTKALFEHYRLHDVRRIVSYASPLILAAFAVAQQLLSGHAGNAVLELIKNLPQATGH